MGFQKITGKNQKGWLYLMSTLLVIGVASCGKSNDPQTAVDDSWLDPGRAGTQDVLKVKGQLPLGAECPSGAVGNLTYYGLSLQDCTEIGGGTLELLQDIQPVFFQANCKDKLLMVRVRQPVGSPVVWKSSQWKVDPDGNFNFTMDYSTSGSAALLKSDGTGGHQNCIEPLQVWFYGNMDCHDPQPDKVKIKVTTQLWLGNETIAHGDTVPVPTASPSPTPSGRAPVPASLPQCKIPSKCYLYGTTTINQCG